MPRNKHKAGKDSAVRGIALGIARDVERACAVYEGLRQCEGYAYLGALAFVRLSPL